MMTDCYIFWQRNIGLAVLYRRPWRLVSRQFCL